VTRVLVIAPVRLYREGLADALERVGGLSVAGTASGVDEGIEEIRLHRPDVVLLDVSDPRNVDAAARIIAAEPTTRIVALALPAADGPVLACAEAGVLGCITRDASIDDVVQAVVSVARGDALCSPGAVATLLRRVAAVAAESRAGRETGALTVREREIAALIEEGLSNKQIASQLFIEVATVKNHVHNILEKLHVRRRNEIHVGGSASVASWD
jgi:DNA-binding NarL/FixJ family response regulator